MSESDHAQVEQPDEGNRTKARLEFLRTIGPLDHTDFALLEALGKLTARDVLPMLPPELRRLVSGDDNPTDTPPPDAPQQ